MVDRGLLGKKEGIVVSAKMNKTAVVEVERLYIHKLYGKAIKTTKKFSAHDEDNKCSVGDKVIIASTKPISKTKNWRVEKIIGKKRIIKEDDTSTN